MAQDAGKGREITGVSTAWVNCLDGLTRHVNEGDKLPPVDKAELERLEALGVFDEHPRIAREAELEELAEANRQHMLGLRSEEEIHAADDLSASAQVDPADGLVGGPLTPPILPVDAISPGDAAQAPEVKAAAEAGAHATAPEGLDPKAVAEQAPEVKGAAATKAP